MKFGPLCLFIFSVLVLAGCQKEPEVDLPENPDPGTNENRLSRIVYQYGPNDSSYTDFFYDAAGRWIGQRSVGDAASVLTEGDAIRVTRNRSGIITGYTVKFEDLGGGEDSVVYTVHYDAAAGRYTSKVYEIEFNGSILVDSTVFVVDNGRLATQRYLFKDRETGVYLEVGRVELVYDAAGNPINLTTYSTDLNNGNSAKEMEIALQYDNKTAALNLGIEAFVVDQLYFAAANNITRIGFREFMDPGNPEESFLNISYEYNSLNKPKSAIIEEDGLQLRVFFRYK